MHTEALTPATAAALKKLHRAAFIKKFYLAGGTALALHYGHRESVDLDWFCERPFRTATVSAALSKLGNFKLVNEEVNTVDGILDGVKVSFFTYPYRMVRRPASFDGFAVACVADIACMKINAIAGRNARKDFIDLFCILEREGWTLADIFRLCDKKFVGSTRDIYHVMRALVYFEEADAQPDVVVTPSVRWETVKKFFVREVKKMQVS